MSKQLRSYTAEFKLSAIALVAAKTHTIDQVAANLGISRDTLKFWLKEHRRKNPPPIPVNPVEESDLQALVKQLRRENERLTLERDILKKAAAFFAREQL